MSSARRLRPDRGVALLLALLVTALCAILASAVLWRVDLWLTQVEVLHDARQAQRLALGGLDWGRSVLWERDRNQVSVDYLGEPWATRVPQIPVAGGEVGGQMFDEQARFNLASLPRAGADDDAAWQAYGRLLEALGLPPALAAALRARLSPSATPRLILSGTGSLDGVPGYSAPVLERLRAFVTVLPETGTTVNVNTASAEVLAAMVPGLTPGDARAVIARRAVEPFINVGGFIARLPEAAQGRVKPDALAVRSRYFRVDTFAKFGRGRAALSALLQRQAGAWPSIVWMRTP
ncbi:general secretion pathway protein K [Mitsuaria sp. BK045]|uniref:type II secretion system minor pseudopilin GspK n=1 Tax=unclassified Roseateles TaxID=2626991 RepID=UPI0016114C62|nr:MULTISPECIES: type II secretion system minor pseudopilin GspK [unclassified Roseateles]MBB3291999.1 general secretion pathway protein K [Mitsuaria sp. BK041]MBB3361216.1 general secretion pathway protein K [Mitsuaria sp. BK045]